MTVTTTATSARYAVHYVGNPASDAAKLRALGEDGPLLLAKEHMMVKLLPEALTEDAATAMMRFSLADFHSLILGGVLLDAEVGTGGMHFAVRDSRLAKFCKDGTAGPSSAPPMAYGPSCVSHPPGPISSLRSREIGSVDDSRESLRAHEMARTSSSTIPNLLLLRVGAVSGDSAFSPARRDAVSPGATSPS